MAVKLRLQRHGGKKRPFYFIVAAHSTVTRDGKFIEKVGTYNPLTIPATIEINRERALYWLNEGAIPTETVNGILSFKGVKFLKHLMRGVKLGLFDEKTALEKFDKWNETHESTVSARREAHKKAKHDVRTAAMAVVVKKVEEVATPVVEEAAPEASAEAAPEVVAEAAPEVVAEAQVEAAPEAQAEAAPEAEAEVEITDEAAPTAE
jgi:small subunit ribosomal protein S16